MWPHCLVLLTSLKKSTPCEKGLLIIIMGMLLLLLRLNVLSQIKLKWQMLKSQEKRSNEITFMVITL